MHYVPVKIRRRAVTLIELLVVVTIMMMLAAYALPKLAPMAKERKIREAARSVNVFLNRARSRAIESGRPCGVVFQRMTSPVDATNPTAVATAMSSHFSNACNTLYQAEVPEPYSGTASGAVMRTQDVPIGWYGGALPAGTVILKAQVQVGSLSNGVLRRGDLIQLNGQGPWYEIVVDPVPGLYGKDWDFRLDPANGVFIDFSLGSDTNPPPSGDGWIDNYWLTLKRVGTSGSVSPWPGATILVPTPTPLPLTGWSNPVSFQIKRQPVRTMTSPLKLPVGVVVDLAMSGIDQDRERFLFSSGVGDVVVMFSPNGSVTTCSWDSLDWGGVAYDPLTTPHAADATQTLYFLIGQQEQVGERIGAIHPYVPTVGQEAATAADADEEAMANWQILTNLWVAISPQTGLISVTENAANSWNQTDTGVFSGVKEARQFARQAQTKGGR